MNQQQNSLLDKVTRLRPIYIRLLMNFIKIKLIKICYRIKINFIKIIVSICFVYCIEQ